MSERIDVLLVERELAKSREKARAMVMAGVVYVNGLRIDKAGATVPENASVEVREDPVPFVSRGGLKLLKAIQVFPIDIKGKVCIDIGASTGGFTDCMLQHGAEYVYAVDVGYGQLDWTLRNDPRVNVMERTNARYMEKAWFDRSISFASIDVSFISLSKILPALIHCLIPGGEAVALIKPQFEAGKSEVGKNGVVRDEKVHRAVCERVINDAFLNGWSVKGLSYSPITGPKGNIEFLMWLSLPKIDEIPLNTVDNELIESVVSEAHIFHA